MLNTTNRGADSFRIPILKGGDNLEFIGMLFFIGLFCILGASSVILIFVLLGIIGVCSMLPEEAKPLVRRISGFVLMVVSLILLLNI